MQDVVEIPVDFKVFGYVAADEAEPGIVEMTRDVFLPAGQQVVHADHVAPFRKEEVAEVGADETGAPRYQHSQSGLRSFDVSCLICV